MRTEKPKHSRVSSYWLGAWSVLIVCGLLWMTAYSMSPGETFTPLLERPDDTEISFSENQPTLLVFLHPRCPCTRPTIAALERLMVRKHDIVLQPVFYLPDTQTVAWAQDEYWDRLIDLGAHEPVIDINGHLAGQFHATTSGHALLFSTDGRVQFWGGITSGRVHEGDSLGLTMLTRVLDGIPVSEPSFPVYGCSIVDKSEQSHEH